MHCSCGPNTRRWKIHMNKKEFKSEIRRYILPYLILISVTLTGRPIKKIAYFLIGGVLEVVCRMKVVALEPGDFRIVYSRKGSNQTRRLDDVGYDNVNKWCK